MTEDFAEPILTVRVEFELGFFVVEAAEARLLRLMVMVMMVMMVTMKIEKLTKPGGKRSSVWEKR